MLTDILVSVAVTLLTTWLLLIAGLFILRAKGVPLAEGLRLLPDVLRLLRRLAADRTLPWTVRARVWIGIAWLISPIDLIPEFLPVIGPADDVIVVAILLRSLIRRAGPETVQRHWPGTPDGLAVLARLCKLPIPPPCAQPASRTDLEYQNRTSRDAVGLVGTERGCRALVPAEQWARISRRSAHGCSAAGWSLLRVG